MSDRAQPGAVYKVRATPKAACDRLVIEGDVIRIYVTVAPEGGKANAAVRAILAAALGLPPSALSLTQGHSARDKVFRYERS